VTIPESSPYVKGKPLFRPFGLSFTLFSHFTAFFPFFALFQNCLIIQSIFAEPPEPPNTHHFDKDLFYQFFLHDRKIPFFASSWSTTEFFLKKSWIYSFVCASDLSHVSG
jgi:hypothetical protein